MSQDQWSAVDRYITNSLVPADAALDAALQAANDAGLPQINVAPNQGKLLMILALSMGARSILEIGTLGGYSTLWLARALPEDGSLVTLELDPKHAQVATASIANAGFADKVSVRVGAALDTLALLAEENRGPFDLVFIDADKANIPGYFEWALKLTRPGSLIITDNVIRQGAVADPTSTDPNVNGVQRFFEMLTSDPRVTATAIQTVGSKGYDGLALAYVN
jgi:predicted O-methyltransferase YrrM